MNNIIWSSAALALASIPGALSMELSPPAGLRGAFDAMANVAKSKVIGLSDHSSAVYDDDGDEPSASAFGTALFSEVSNSTSGNILLSPLSLYKCLALVKAGATIDSLTEAEMAHVLGPSPQLEPTEGEGVTLNIANSVWANELRESYVEGLKEKYSADAFPLPSRYTDIDNWIEDKTNGMIKGLLGDDDIDGDVVALLVNTVYFKGMWTQKFDPTFTYDGDFVKRDDSKLPAKFMKTIREMEYIEESPALGGASAVILDYGEQSSEDEPTEFTSMFILPKSADADSMSAVIEGLNSQPISQLLGEATKDKVELHLPRFKLEFGPAKLSTILESMGMKAAFDRSTNHKFDEMSDNPTVYLSEVFHGTAMEVTEAGTEAAAGSAAEMRKRSKFRGPQMRFDRPFVVAVIHRESGSPIFLGRLEEPVLDID